MGCGHSCGHKTTLKVSVSSAGDVQVQQSIILPMV